MSLSKGQSLSFYEVLGPLGAGGMGEVYLARDTRLDREVAIKVLPEELADDEERLRRFEREAKTLASLNHPNVAGIHGIDQVDDTCFLAMELVPGEDLEARLRRGALPLEEALDVCGQIAEGLEAAHEAGVVHRDLKPANVRITPDGVVKLLDFGLAKPTRPKISSESGTTTAESDSFLMTEEGLVLGTPTYMSPEQARGKPVDRRTDIWAFGCVLFECLTGERAFAGDSMTDILAAIVGSEPDWSRLPPLPPRVEELLRRCLTKDPRHRLRDVGEARILLQAGDSDTASEIAATERAGVRGSRSSVSLAVGATLVVGTGLGVLIASLLREPAAEVQEQGSLAADVAGLRFALPAMTEEDGVPVPWRHVVLSPDGRQFAAATIDGLVVRRLDSFDPIRIRLDAKDLVDHVGWSPDGASLTFCAGETLYRVSATGGKPVRLFDDEGFKAQNGSAWLDDGRIVFTHGDEERAALLAISSSGGRPAELVTFEGEEEGRSHFHDVAPLPAGRVLAVLHRDGEPGRDLVAIDDAGMHTLLELRDEEINDPQYVDPGFVLFSRGDPVSGETWAQPISLDTLEPTGELFPVQSDMRHPSVSRNGTLAYVEQNGDPVSTLVWWTPDGAVQPFGREHEGFAVPMDHDPRAGLVLFMTFGGAEAGELWRHELERGVSTRIRPEGLSPTWGSLLSDGRIVVTSREEDEHGDERMVSYLLPASGLGAPERWLDGHVYDVSGDLRFALFSGREEDEAHLYVADLESDAPPLRIRTAKNFDTASISPDGRWALYDTGETGNTQVYLTRFPSGEGDWQVSVDDGVFGKFAPDGGHIYFREARGPNLSRVTFQDEPEVRLGAPEPVGEPQQQVLMLTGLQDADGKRFLATQMSGSLTGDLVIVLGWANELAER